MSTMNAAMNSAAPMNVFFLSTLQGVFPRGRRHGVMAARVKGRALDHAARGEPGAPERTMRPHRFGCVVGARGIKPAAARRPEYDRQDRRGGPLVDPDQADRGGRGESR